MRRRLLPITALAVTLVFAFTFGFAAGHNLHSRSTEYYTRGFKASLRSLPELASAYFEFRRRDYEIADPVEQEHLIEQARALRIGVYRPWEDYRIPVYDGLDALGLDVRIVEPASDPEELLESLDVVIFPQGWYELSGLPAGEGERLRRAIAGGLDYIGICAGTYFAVKDLEIAPVVHNQLFMVSILTVRTLENEFWGELGGHDYQTHFSGGGYFPIDSLGAFEPLVEMANVGPMAIQGTYGKGRVILFTFHPEGGGLTRNNQTFFWSGRALGSGEMLLKALENLAAEGDR